MHKQRQLITWIYKGCTFSRNFPLIFQIQQACDLNQQCRNKGISFIFCQVDSNSLSMFCDPIQNMVDNFIGENPRPENDLLISEDISKDDQNEDVIKITCAKKHYLQIGNKISLLKKDSNLRTVCSEVIDVISDKAFTVKASKDFDMDSYCVIKLLSRKNHQGKYVSLMYIQCL